MQKTNKTKPLKSYFQKEGIEAGCDEAGRGCLAGPVFAAAVILPKNFKNSELRDSKKLNEVQRMRLRELIFDKAIACAIDLKDQFFIDEHNILNASISAMQDAVKKLAVKPSRLLIDGNKFYPFDQDISYHCIIKGDDLFYSIAAASILAKTERDLYMTDLHNHFPEYNWASNKGYATADHIDALKRFGPTYHHRQSFELFQKNELTNQTISLFD